MDFSCLYSYENYYLEKLQGSEISVVHNWLLQKFDPLEMTENWLMEKQFSYQKLT